MFYKCRFGRLLFQHVMIVKIVGYCFFVLWFGILQTLMSTCQPLALMWGWYFQSWNMNLTILKLPPQKKANTAICFCVCVLYWCYNFWYYEIIAVNTTVFLFVFFLFVWYPFIQMKGWAWFMDFGWIFPCGKTWWTITSYGEQHIEHVKHLWP